MRKIALLFLMVISIMSLSACGGKDDKQNETKPTLEVIKPTETESETLQDKLDETKTFTIEPAPALNRLGIDEDGNTIEESSPFIAEDGITENGTGTSVGNSGTNNVTNSTSGEDSKTSEEESKMAEENNAKRIEIEESVAESLEADENVLSSDDYQQIDNAIDDYTKKEAEELLEGVDTSKL